MTVTTLPTDTFSAAAVAAIGERFREPTWLRQAREAAWETFQATPWPTYTEETWRRTRLTGFDLANFSLATDPVPAVSSRRQLSRKMSANLRKMDSGGALVFQDASLIYAELDPDLAARGVVFTDLRTALREHEELVRTYLGAQVLAADNKFAALHYALWQNGTFLYVPRHVTVEKPFQVLVQFSPGKAAFHHTLIIADENSELTIAEDYLGAARGMSDTVVELYPLTASRLHYLHLQNLDTTAWNFATMRASLARDTLYRHLQASWGSRLSKVWIDLNLEEPGSHGELLGLYFPQGRQHIDHHTNQNHKRPRGTSDLLFKGALKGKSRSVWQGMIYVAPGAQKTDGYQANRNLVLDERARADSIPGLEICADDVRCTHGATVGKLEQEPLFYIKSRGIPQAEAEKLVVEGFFDPIFQRIPFEGVRERFQEYIAAKMAE
jgi:Fe-S cluster assembly protein SufD